MDDVPTPLAAEDREANRLCWRAAIIIVEPQRKGI